MREEKVYTQMKNLTWGEKVQDGQLWHECILGKELVAWKQCLCLLYRTRKFLSWQTNVIWAERQLGGQAQGWNAEASLGKTLDRALDVFVRGHQKVPLLADKPKMEQRTTDKSAWR